MTLVIISYSIRTTEGYEIPLKIFNKNYTYLNMYRVKNIGIRTMFYASLPVRGKIDKPFGHARKVLDATRNRNLPSNEGNHNNSSSDKELSNIEKSEKELECSSKLPDNFPKNSTSSSPSSSISFSPKMPEFSRSSTYVTKPSVYPQEQQRGYASYSINDPDPQNMDPLAVSNNTPIPNKQHPEVHRITCANCNCIGQFCTQVCNTQTGRKAIAHASHGQSNPSETTKKTVKNVSQTSFYGKSTKPQNLVFYDQPHNVSPTKEHVTGTQKINSDVNLQNIINTHEKP